jgi:uncharacterized protein YciI
MPKVYYLISAGGYTMYFMSINKFNDDAERTQINKVISVHREWTKQQLAAGILVQAGKWGERGGMIIIRAESLSEAKQVVDQDPLAQAGLITFETAQLHPAMPFK